MRFEHQDICLWYGTDDAPAPLDTVEAAAEVTITIGVYPADANNKVELLYRVNRGPTERVDAHWLRSIHATRSHYFRAQIPHLRDADNVDYSAVCRCAGRQVPSLEEAAQFTSSFHVVQAEAKAGPYVDSMRAAPVAATRASEASIAPGRAVARMPSSAPPMPPSSGNGVPPEAAWLSMPPAAPAPIRLGPPPLESGVLDYLKTPGSSETAMSEAPNAAHNEVHKAILSSLLSTSSTVVASQLQDKFLNLYAAHDGPIDAFWSQLRQNPDFGATAVGGLQLMLQLGALTQNHVPLIQDLQSTLHVTSVRDLVKLDAAAWTGMISKQSVGVPQDVPGETAQEKVANYVDGIVRVLQAAFPTDVVAQIVATAPGITLDDPARKTMSQFFANAPDFDLRTSHVDKYIAANATSVFKDIAAAEQPRVAGLVKRTQRLFQVSTNPETMTALLRTNLDSAHAIAQIPRSSFMAMHTKALGGEQQAAMVYERAVAGNARTLHVYTQLYQSAFDVQPAAVGSADDAHEAIKTLPSYTDLFGSLDLCDCDHCRSVYSPAAYFVDLLEFLKHSTPNSGGMTPLDVLVGTDRWMPGRRPDLPYIKLTCENTNTTIPYVDLVNEVLESYVTYRQSLPFLGGIPTSPLPPGVSPMPYTPAPNESSDNVTSGELSANPENTNEPAYEQLRMAVYPLTLPYNQPLEVARVYLQQLGSSRADLMRTFVKDNGALAPIRALAAESLDISPEEFQVLTGKDFAGANSSLIVSLREAYGYDGDDIARKVNNQYVTRAWRDWLADVPEFVQRTGVAYTDVIELLKTQFINPEPESPNAITVYAPASTCNLSLTSLRRLDGAPLDDGQLSRIHRFIRLWRKVGWSMRDLDRTITALHVADIDSSFLVDLVQIRRVHADLKLPLAQLLSVWATIDVQGDDSLYRKLFLSKAALKIDAVFQPQLDGSVLGDAAQTVSQHIPALVAAIRISEAELTSIGVDAALPADSTPLTLASVSVLYRYAVLARALKLRVTDLISLKMLSGVDPFSGPEKTGEFVEIARQVQQSGFTIAQVEYLFRHVAEPSANLVPRRDSLMLIAKGLRDRLTKIGEDNQPVNDPTGELSRNKLGMIFEAGIADQTIRMVDGSTVYTTTLKGFPADFQFPIELKNKVAYDGKSELLSFKGPMTPDSCALLKSSSGSLAGAGQKSYRDAVDALFFQPRSFIKDTLSGFLDVTAAGKILLDIVSLDEEGKPVSLDKDGHEVLDATTQSPVTTVIAEKFFYLLNKFLPYLRESLSRTLIKQTMSEALKLDGAISELLLEKLTTRSAMTACLALSTPGLSAEYCADPQLAVSTSSRIDGTVAFDGAAGTAETSIPVGIGSARWTGMLVAPNNGDFTFYINASGSAQLWVGDDPEPTQLVSIDPRTSERASSPLPLKAGQLYILRLEVRQLIVPATAQSAVAECRWSSPTTPKAFIPLTHLYPSSIFDAFGTAFTLLQKCALLVNGLEMTDKEVAYVSGASAEFDNFDLSSLPLERSQPLQTDQKAVALFAQWRRLSAFVSLRGRMVQGNPGLVDIFEAKSLANTLPLLEQGSTGAAVIALQRLLNATGTQPALAPDGVFDLRVRTAVTSFQQSHGLNGSGTIEPPTWEAIRASTQSSLWQPVMTEAAKEEALARGFGWDAKSLHALRTALGLTVDDFQNEIWLVRLDACMNAVTRLGVSGEQAFEWATSAWDAKQAQAIKNTVKAKYDDENWLAVAKPVNDALRESQKAALIAYLLPRLGMNDSNQLFEYFLIDVDMSTCMATSRIKQAISSVQLFVQRCLMNLERRQDVEGLDTLPSVLPAAIDVDQWQWMKSYRTWEANRKVFLYPENWIEPELRDDKSPFFKELESELLQGDLTKDAAETALLSYLAKLDQISRLEICGVFGVDTDPETKEPVNIQHVFGRTFHTPHIYYYRRLETDRTWTAWERVQVDIEGDHLVPVVWNRRLYIFWPVFVPTATHESTEPSLPDQKWEIRLAWSEQKQGRWLPKQVSSAVLVLDGLGPSESGSGVAPDNRYLTNKSAYFFKGLVTNNNLAVQVYSSTYSACLGEFAFTGCAGRIQSTNFFWSHQAHWPSVDGAMRAPANNSARKHGSSDAAVWFMSFLEPLESGDVSGGNLTVHSGTFGDQPNVSNDLFDTRVDLLALRRTPSQYSLLLPHQFRQFVLQAPFFYQDDERVYFVTPIQFYFVVDQLSHPDNVIMNRTVAAPKLLAAGNDGGLLATRSDSESMTRRMGIAPGSIEPVGTIRLAAGVHEVGNPPAPIRLSSSASNWTLEGRAQGQWAFVPVTLRFSTHFHPYVCDFIKSLNRFGNKGLLTLNNQILTDLEVEGDVDTGERWLVTNFTQLYLPNTDAVVDPTGVREGVEFDRSAAYSLYNWELFFHIPLLIACRLSKNQRFEDAQRWFHYIFDPTRSSTDASPQRYWNVMPFRSTDRTRIEDLLVLLSTDDNGLDSEQRDRKKQLMDQWEALKEHPFLPHLIARARPTAYQKTVVMKYIDNLIAWGDQLFRQDSIEAMNEATQLYVLAANILGRRPERIPRRGKVAPETYATLREKLDVFGNALVPLENEFPSSGRVAAAGTGSESGGLLGLGRTLYFCTPQNDKMLGYWDTVADRLFKIRHCMNIEGVTRQVPLFEPPIDPGLLVQAVAQGVDVSSVLNDLNAPTPYYRFGYMLAKALELCADLKSLSGALLAALEKQDAEELSTLRASHETIILNLVKDVRQNQIEEAQSMLDGLQKTLAVNQFRQQYYDGLVKQGLIPYETEHLAQLHSANTAQDMAGYIELGGQALKVLGELVVSMTGGPVIGPSFLADAAATAARYYNIQAGDATYQGNKASLMGGHSRRSDEWTFQAGLTAKETDQINKQILGASIRRDIAQRELANHTRQIENSQKVEEFLRDKYTNHELYVWMMSEVSTVYFQCYQMAYDMARKAEKAFRFERGLTTSNFIQFGYWDSLREGLQSGERLYLALRQMERAYLEQNKREYEITKHVSLVLNDPMALMRLKETGQCEVVLPEALFNADYPGHFMRRLKSVSLTMPCVVGPYTSINCTLTLLGNKTRITSAVGGGYEEDMENEDARFVTNFAAMQSVATSHAQNDSGMFELNFRDERYLPFEGAGAVSRWRIDMPKETNAFDFSTLTDVVLHLKYTAREGGEILGRAARKAMEDPTSSENAPMARLFSAKHEFPSEWHRFLHPSDASASSQALQLDLTQERFPFQFRGKPIDISQVDVFLKFKDATSPLAQDGKTYAEEYAAASEKLAVSLEPPGPGIGSSLLKSEPSFMKGIPHASIAVGARVPFTWRLEATDEAIKKVPSSLFDSVTIDGKPHQRLKAEAIEDVVMVCRYSLAQG